MALFTGTLTYLATHSVLCTWWGPLLAFQAASPEIAHSLELLVLA